MNGTDPTRRYERPGVLLAVLSSLALFRAISRTVLVLPLSRNRCRERFLFCLSSEQHVKPSERFTVPETFP